MAEPTLAIIAFLKLVWTAGFAFLYARGGMTWKVWRRYIAPFWFMAGAIGFSLWQNTFSWLIPLSAGLLYGALHLGYGADTFVAKLRRRTVYALAILASAVPLIFVNHLYGLFILHGFVCLAVTVGLGVFNFARSARDEETIIGFTAVFLPMYMI